MESRLNRQKNAMISLAKPKNKISLPEKKDTWGKLLNKKSASTNTVIGLNQKPFKNSSNSDRITNTISKSVQCSNSPNNSPNNEFCQNSNLLSVFNPIRTLQFLLKEIMEVPNIKNTNTIQIVNEMQTVVERIVNECSKKPELLMPIMDENMIPTKENDYSSLKYDNNSLENKYWLVLLGKISELEKNYSHLTQNYIKSGEKIQNITSERDKLLEKFKESCDSLETLNNREREYLNTITELKAKVMASEKLISKQEAIIINLNQKLNSLDNKSPKLAIDKMSAERQNMQEAVCNENHQFKNNGNYRKFNLDNLKLDKNFRNDQVSKLTSDIQQMKQIVLTGMGNSNNSSVFITPLKPNGNHRADFSEYKTVNKSDMECGIDAKYSEYNRQASAIKQAKVELQQLFETIKSQANHSKKLFNSTLVDNEKNLSGISDEDDNHSNFMSVITESSC